MSSNKPVLKRTQTETQNEWPDEQETWLEEDEKDEDLREVWMLCDDDKKLAQVYDYLERNLVPKNYHGPIWIDDDVFILDLPINNK